MIIIKAIIIVIITNLVVITIIKSIDWFSFIKSELIRCIVCMNFGVIFTILSSLLVSYIINY